MKIAQSNTKLTQSDKKERIKNESFKQLGKKVRPPSLTEKSTNPKNVTEIDDVEGILFFNFLNRRISRFSQKTYWDYLLSLSHSKNTVRIFWRINHYELQQKNRSRLWRWYYEDNEIETYRKVIYLTGEFHRAVTLETDRNHTDPLLLIRQMLQKRLARNAQQSWVKKIWNWLWYRIAVIKKTCQ